MIPFAKRKRIERGERDAREERERAGNSVRNMDGEMREDEGREEEKEKREREDPRRWPRRRDARYSRRVVGFF